MWKRLQSLDIVKRFSRWLLAFDSFFDSSVFDSGRKSQESYEDFSAFMSRFQLSGVAWVATELACESLTLILVALIGAMVLATTAFTMTSEHDWLKRADLAVSFFDRYGVEVGQRGIKHDDAVQIEDYPDYLLKAVLATEDRRFYEHFGIDVIGTMRALTVNARSSTVVQGGSSITQQLAKNLFLSNERTFTRKINEAFLALWLEHHLTKREILKLYLDRVYMGGGAFGVQAAAEFYFGKSVKDVTLAEAAMLAGLFKAPAKYAPHVNLPAARARANDVLNNLVDAGFMNSSQILAAQRNPATPVAREEKESPDWYLDWAWAETQRLAAAGKLGDDRVLNVRLALDSNVQKRADEVVDQNLRESGRTYNVRQGAAVVMEPDGAVRAIVGGKDYGASQFNRATEAMRQPGSSFKPYVYLTALMTGKFNPSTIVVDSPVCIGNWCPHNFGGSYAGSLPLANALARSLNTVAVKLSISIGYDVLKTQNVSAGQAAKAGRAKIVETARRLGLTAPLEDTPSLPIGADEVTVIEHAAAYAAFVNGGKKTTPYAATEITNRRGEVLYRHDRDAPKQEQAVPFEKVVELGSMMRKVVEEGTGKRAQLGSGIDVIGKTGTTNGFKDAWFCGYSGTMGGCIWYGNDDGEQMNNMTGGALPAGTWHDIMAYAHQGLPLKPIVGMKPAAPQETIVSANSSGVVIDLGGAPARPASLSKGAVEALGAITTKIETLSLKKPRVETIITPQSARAHSVLGADRPGRAIE